jgi:hypothetical protein
VGEELVTAIYYEYASGGAGPTQILETTKLLEAMQEDGFFDQFEDIDLWRANSRFDADYGTYEAALREERPTASEEDQAKIDTCLETRAGWVPYTATDLPLVVVSSFGGQPALVFDERARCYDIYDRDTGESHHNLLRGMWMYLKNEGELKERGIIHTIEGIPGTVLMFPREGTLHRGVPGTPDEVRLARIGTVATATPARMTQAVG